MSHHTAIVRKGYAFNRWGQLHYRETGEGPQPPLVCLHATAYSSRSFLPFMPELADSRRVIALDTPGYGESDAPPEPPTLAAYAEVMATALRVLSPDRPVDLFGYHTGALIATEMAAQAPERVRRIVLIGVPYFERLDKAAWRARLVHQNTLDDRLDQFKARWDFFVTQRAAGYTLARGFDNFVDELKSYPRDGWAHQALFDYPCTERLALVRCPVLVINPASTLAEASRHAAEVLPDARVLERPDLGGALFDQAAAPLAQAMRAFLDAPP